MKRFSPLLLNALTVLCLLTPAAHAGHILDRTVVTVNDDVILESDVEKFRQKAKSKSFQEMFGGIDPKALNDRATAISLLIDEKIIDQQVKKLDLKASDQEVDGQIRSILKRNNISEVQLTDRLKQLGTTMQDYRDGIRRQLERHNLVDREIKPTLEFSDEQLRHFYQRNGGGGDNKGEMQYKIAHILISGSDKAAEDKANKVYADVLKSGNFDQAVKDSSDDNTTTANGGVLGTYSLDSLAKELRQSVPRTKAGNITKPIKMADGYHIVKVLEAAPADFASMSKEKKDALRNQMLSGELEKRMAMWLERKRNDAHIKIYEQPMAVSEPAKK